MKKKAYKTLRGNIYLLDLLPKEHQDIVKKLRKDFKNNLSHQVFQKKVAIALYQKLEIKPEIDALTRLPLFVILHDMEERLLVKQGKSTLIVHQNVIDQDPFIQDSVDLNDVTKSYEILFNLIKELANSRINANTDPNLAKFVEQVLRLNCSHAKDAEYEYLAAKIAEKLKELSNLFSK